MVGTQQQEPLAQPKQSPAPASAQNAFSQKTGSNTSAAIEKDFREGNIKPFVPEQSTPETSSGTQESTQKDTSTRRDADTNELSTHSSSVDKDGVVSINTGAKGESVANVST